jgi:hypothetical protein
VRNILALVVAAIALSACETPTAQRYSVSADNNLAIKALGASGIGIRAFAEPEKFNVTCRALGPIKVADGLTHTQYIQKAFEDELKIAGVYAAGQASRVTLGGNVRKLEFSSSQGLTRGYWQIELTLDSSNGKKLDVTERYDFDSGFMATEACRNTAEAFTRAVQNLIGKAVTSPEFKGMVESASQ